MPSSSCSTDLSLTWTEASGAVRITFLDFSSAFNTIQPLLLRDKLTEMGVGSHLVAWITDYLTGRPQYVRLGDCRTSDTVASSTGAPQRTVLSPVLFTLYTSDFQYKHMKNAPKKNPADPTVAQDDSLLAEDEDDLEHLVENTEDLLEVIKEMFGHLLLKLESTFNVLNRSIDELVGELQFIPCSASGPILKDIESTLKTVYNCYLDPAVISDKVKNI
ncbi:hypothetical protein L3Q82_025367 [Scortum barcoo]|uniref:Uncharacterized protein n=1 Tax=Scortum barcoo TaxID=214431 RepID=A0ACB8WPS5_9TELE|nr:hypothetical protein L3Q82_025367 [Scortum barcoo]